jgi:hypothetical protein
MVILKEFISENETETGKYRMMIQNRYNHPHLLTRDDCKHGVEVLRLLALPRDLDVLLDDPHPLRHVRLGDDLRDGPHHLPEINQTLGLNAPVPFYPNHLIRVCLLKFVTKKFFGFLDDIF